MPCSSRKLLGLLSAAFAAATMLLATHAPADVVGDDSLGSPSAIAVDPSGNDFTIPPSAGERADANVFFSFSEFDLTDAQRATFTADGATGIDNLIGRIRDVEGSSIDGTVASEVPGASLFLLNPFGILFGENAKVDVKGSFYASTADYLRLGDGSGEFHARHIARTQLSVAPPTAFGFLGEASPASIQVGAQLEVAPAGVLGLVGGDLGIQGAELVAESGRIDLASVGPGAGEVRFDGSLVEPLLDVSDFAELGTISLAGRAQLRTRMGLDPGPGGVVVIRGGDFVMEGSSQIDSSTTGGDDHPGIGLDAYLSGSFAIDRSFIRSSTSGDGNAGSVRIHAGELTMTESSRFDLRIRTPGNGSGAGLHVLVDGHARLDNGAVVDATAERGTSGDLGSIVFEARSLEIGKRAVMRQRAVPGSTGDAGAIDIHVVEALEVHEPGQIRERILTEAGGAGAGGDIRVSANQVLLKGDVEILTKTVGAEAGGDIHVSANEVRLEEGAKIVAEAGGAGVGGDIHVFANKVLLKGEAGIQAKTTGSETATGGSVYVDATKLEVSDFAYLSTPTFGLAPGGNVHMDAERIVLSNGAFIAATTFFAQELPPGTVAPHAGAIGLHAEQLEVRERAFVSTSSEGIGDAGPITVDAHTVNLMEGGVIASNTLSAGNAGRIEVRAHEILIDGAGEVAGVNPAFSFSGISTGARNDEPIGSRAGGAPGDIEVFAEQLRVLNGGKIGGRNFGPSPTGGSVEIRANLVRVAGEFGDGADRFSAISTDSDTLQGADPGGAAGGIAIRGRESAAPSQLSVDDGGVITSVTRTGGRGGDVTVEFDEVRIERGAGLSAASSGTSLTAVEAPGDAGNVTVIGRDGIALEGGVVTTAALEADGGNIKLTSDGVVAISRDSSVDASVRGGEGSGGNVVIDPHRVIVEDSTIAASAAAGPGGNVTIAAQERVVVRNGTLIAEVVGGGGDGGNIEIRGPQGGAPLTFTILDGSLLDASAEGGSGGSIFLGADFLFATPDSVLNVTSRLQNDGEIIIRSPDSNVAGQITRLPEEFVDVAELLHQRCAVARRERLAGSFVVTGRSGVPANPDGFLPAPLGAAQRQSGPDRVELRRDPESQRVTLRLDCAV